MSKYIAEQYAFLDNSTHMLVDGKAMCGNEMASIGVYQDWSKVTCSKCRALNRDISKPPPQAAVPEPCEKKEPCYEDDDSMPFGKYRLYKMKDVPASYLHWLWSQRPLGNKKVENYIANNIEALKKEHKDGIWQ